MGLTYLALVNLKQKLLILGSGAIVALLLLVGYYYVAINKSDSSRDSLVDFVVERGDSVHEIASKLYNDGIITNETVFYLYVRLNGYDDNIVAGGKYLTSSMSIVEVVDVLMNSQKNYQVSVIIREGLTIPQIDAELTDIGVIESGDFIKGVFDFSDYDSYDFLNQGKMSKLPYPLEGYLYPDTYFIEPLGFDVDIFIHTMLNNFETRVSDVVDLSKCPYSYTSYDCIIMASIIEKEVFGEKDRGIVSGIFWKRLENNWTLGADATMLYLADDNVITISELSEDSDYNTRKNKGLPLGPICSPSVSAIKAAFMPIESDYWFYLTTLDTGDVIYAKTNEEHNVNRLKYL